jgi:hypothetical protein
MGEQSERTSRVKDVGRAAGALVVGVAAVDAFNEFGITIRLVVGLRPPRQYLSQL